MIRAVWGDVRGGAGVLVAAVLPVLIGAGALAVDLGSVQLETRRLQGIADAAAIDAAVDPVNAQTRAEQSLARSGWPRAATVQAQAGTYSQSSSTGVGVRFSAGGAAPDAVRVTVASQSPTFLARIFGQTNVAISRTATAKRQRAAAFSIGSRLASLNNGLLNAYLGALTGSNVSLSVMDYNALASADVDLFAFLSAVRTRAGVDAGTYADVLNTQVTGPQALSALADALGAGTAGALVRLMAATVPGGQSVTLSTLIDAGPLGRQTQGGTGIARVNALAMITALLQLSSPQHQVSLDLGATIPGLSSVTLTLAVGDRVRQSPWIAISDIGAVIVRTAQTRAYVDARLAPTLLPGLIVPVSARVPVFVELAAAEAKVADIRCPSTDGKAVDIDARTNPGRAALGTVDPATVGDFGAAVTVSRATIVDTPLVDVVGSSEVSLGASEPWQRLTFNAAAITAGTMQTVRSTQPVGGVAASLMAHPTLQVILLGLPIPISPLVSAVGGLLQTAAGPIDGLLGLVSGTLGVGIGEADVRVTGIRCGMAALVA